MFVFVIVIKFKFDAVLIKLTNSDSKTWNVELFLTFFFLFAGKLWWWMPWSLTIGKISSAQLFSMNSIYSFKAPVLYNKLKSIP